MSGNKFSAYRKSYKEKKNRKYRNEQFEYKSINYGRFIMEKGIQKYRVHWKNTVYTQHKYKTAKVQELLQYFKHDIRKKIHKNGKVIIKWKDSYVAKVDIVEN